MKRALPALVLAALFSGSPWAAPLGGEENPLIRLDPFTVEGPGAEEGPLLESLIRSYLADFGELLGYYETLAPAAGFGAVAGAGSGGRMPDYILSGSIRQDREGRVFTIELWKAATGERKSSAAAYRSTGELLLRARSLVEGLFASGDRGEPLREELRPEALSEQGISGVWKGEPGIEMILLYPGARGLILFSSGAQMTLAYLIENNSLRLRQTSPNRDRFYYHYPLSPAQAAFLALSAEPVRWDLLLYERGAVLRGKRTFTGLGEGGEALPGLVEEVEWRRTH
jgi:hypothetical protein